MKVYGGVWGSKRTKYINFSGTLDDLVYKRILLSEILKACSKQDATFCMEAL